MTCCRLEEEGIITDCSLRTMGDCEIIDFDMADDEVICKMILRAPDFREVLADLDNTSDLVEFLLSPDDPYFRITTEGVAGKFQVSKTRFPKKIKVIRHLDTVRILLQG